MRLSVIISVIGLQVLGSISAFAGEMEAKDACAKAIAAAAGVDATALTNVEIVPKDGQWMKITAQADGSDQSWTCKANAEGSVKEDTVMKVSK